MKTAIFSNGHKDTYKGARDVRAAWMLTHKETGKVIASGHSLDREKAEKTARGTIPRKRGLPSGWRIFRNTIQMYKCVRAQGYESPDAMAADYRRINAEYAKEFAIEIVDL